MEILFSKLEDSQRLSYFVESSARGSRYISNIIQLQKNMIK